VTAMLISIHPALDMHTLGDSISSEECGKDIHPAIDSKIIPEFASGLFFEALVLIDHFPRCMPPITHLLQKVFLLLRGDAINHDWLRNRQSSLPAASFLLPTMRALSDGKSHNKTRTIKLSRHPAQFCSEN
jgi:hypothetical protein